MPVLIGMRCLQAIGSSAVISVGAGSLADMYEVHERGQKVGLPAFLYFFLSFFPIFISSCLLSPVLLSFDAFLTLASVHEEVADGSLASSMECLYLVPL